MEWIVIINVVVVVQAERVESSRRVGENRATEQQNFENFLLPSPSFAMHLGVLQMSDAAMRKSALDSPLSHGLYVTHRITSIVGGLIAPLVVLSSFPGLTETWRVIQLPDGEVERLPDPTLLVVGEFFRSFPALRRLTLRE